MAWRPDFSANGKPFYLAIADALADDVRRGVVQPGEKLPTQRELAAAMGLDLTTITRAYAEAARRGLIVGEGRRGSFVRGGPAESGDALAGGEAASGMNMPPEPEDGSLRRAILDGTASSPRRFPTPRPTRSRSSRGASMGCTPPCRCC